MFGCCSFVGCCVFCTFVALNSIQNYYFFPTSMLRDEFIFQITQCLQVVPTQEQHHAIDVFVRFLLSAEGREAMLLCGSAGTGKTTLGSAMVRSMVQMSQRVVLLAPTGRSAKVFSLNSGMSASTIHRQIYRQKEVGELYAQFSIAPNKHSNTLFFVDEASMISAGNGERRSVLDDLIEYVYSGRNCRLVLIGDAAQLPPVGEEESPALQKAVLEQYGLKVFSATLNEVLRQSEQSGILFNATLIRRMIDVGSPTALPKVRLKGFADICSVPGSELIEQLSSSYGEVGMDETMVITRSNKRANLFNQGIRNTILGCEEELTRGDWLMIVKNKYLKSDQSSDELEGETFIANGDRAIVQRVRNIHRMHGFRFADVLLQFPDYDNQELQTTLILESLTSEAPQLTAEQTEALYQSIMEDYADLTSKREKHKAIRNDMYFNALQVKYAYAVTCHKAQGGQWAHIYLDQGYMTADMLTTDYIHWLYTAFTRATEKLFLINWPDQQVAD